MLDRECSQGKENKSITTGRNYKADILSYGRIVGFFYDFL